MKKYIKPKIEGFGCLETSLLAGSYKGDEHGDTGKDKAKRNWYSTWEEDEEPEISPAAYDASWGGAVSLNHKSVWDD